MAISTVGFGLKPINKLGSNYNAAQVSEYKSVDTGYDLAFQMPVKANDDELGLRVIPQYSVTDPLTGSFVGCQYVSKSTGKPVFADHLTSSDLPDGNTQASPDYYKFFSVFVTDDPYQLYSMKIDGDLTLSNMTGNYSPNQGQTGLTAISSDGTRSIVKLDSSTKTNNSLRALKLCHIGTNQSDVSIKTSGYTNASNDVLAANSNVVVTLNQSKFKPGTYGNV